MRLHLFPCRDRRISIPLSSSCPGRVDEASFYIGSYELNANLISDIKTLKPSDGSMGPPLAYFLSAKEARSPALGSPHPTTKASS